MVTGGHRRLGRLVAALVAALLLATCGGSDGDEGSASGSGGAGAASTTAAPAEDDDEGEGDDEEPATTLPPGAVPGLDDYSGDGELDPTCGTHDFGGGLVLRVPCRVATPNGPPDGVTLVDGSLFGYNGSTDIELTGISGSLLLARSDAGQEIIIVTFNTDNLFEVGSSDVRSPDTMDNTIRLLNEKWPGAKIQVRGHTDSTGSEASNQALSERRAASVKRYLEEHGLRAPEITAVGFGETQPFAKEDNDAARRFNRRVEIVVRVA